MKKSLLMAAAAVIAVSASAQMRVQQKPATLNKQATVDTRSQEFLTKEAQAFTGSSKATAAPKKVRPADAPKYRRPAGSFYGAFASNFYGYGYSALFVKPYTDQEFKNMSEAPATDWKYWVYNSETRANDELDFSGTDFSYTYGYTAVPCPTLYAGDLSYSATQRTSEVEGVVATENGEIWSLVNATDIYGTNLPGNYLVSPHYSSGTRYEDESMAYSFMSYTGALDADGGSTGRWFGKNYSGWNGFALAVEQPAAPYVLNKVYAYAYGISLSGDVELTAKVYRLPEMPQYSDEAARVDPEVFNDENLIATGSYTLTRAALGDGTSMMLSFDLEQYDPELDMSYSVTPEIDFPIFIVISGYDADSVNSFTFGITTEDEDEGWGEHTFNCHFEDGVLTACRGLNMFFALSEDEGMPLKVGPSIFMDISMPFLTYNFVAETGEYTFPNAGGSYMSLGQYEGVYFYGIDQYSEQITSESIFYSLEDGSDVPEWLTITLEDEQMQSDGETYTMPKAKVTCAALPEGVDYREAKVKFYINGANLIYTFMQGVKSEGNPYDVTGDGNVDIADINEVINYMLGKSTSTKTDVTGDGNTDIADINAIINNMLGK